MMPSEITENESIIFDDHIVRNTRSIISDLFYGIRVDIFKCSECKEKIEEKADSLRSI